MSGDWYKPSALDFKLGDSVMDAIVAVHGQTKLLPNGKKITLTTDLFKKTVSEWSQLPHIANHIKQFGIGKIHGARIGDNGELIMRFDVTDKKALDLMWNDAFAGFSIGFDPKTAKISSDGILTEAKPDHLATIFFPFKPVCGKDTCHVIFSDNGTSRSCLCESNEGHSVAQVRFSKDTYNRTDAKTWIENSEFKGAVFEDSSDHYIFSLNSSANLEDTKETYIDAGITAIVSFGGVEGQELSISTSESVNKDSNFGSVLPEKDMDEHMCECQKHKETPKEGMEFNTTPPATPPAAAPVVDTKILDDLKERVGNVDKITKELEAERTRAAQLEVREKEIAAKLTMYEERERKEVLAAMPALTPEVKEALDIASDKWDDLKTDELRRAKRIIDRLTPKKEEPKKEAPPVKESNLPPVDAAPADPAKTYWNDFYKGKK